DRAMLEQIAANCRRVPANGAQDLHEAVQAFALLWQAMCLEQAPNPYAFSVGNLDRILQPYLQDVDRDEAVQLVRHLLAFFMVGDRCWAISQNLMVGGRDARSNDLTNEMTCIVLDAFYRSNLPQPALSVKLHLYTPEALYRSMGRFFFTPGHSTPSIFNDDEMFEVLRHKGIDEDDIADYGIAGCQEPLIMGKESGNTTNSWLNLAKILELTLNDGKSLISGEKIGLSFQQLGYEGSEAVYSDLQNAFQKQLDHFLKNMETAANACTRALGKQAAPFTSSLMGCLQTGRDIRNPEEPGVKYNSSGCLVHGLSVFVDSFVAVRACLEAGIASAEELRAALQDNFKGTPHIREFLLGQDKYGNAIEHCDALAAELAETVCDKIDALRNPAGNPFRPDFSTPSTHLLYGYWVGATPDGRLAREMLGYGVDPLPGAAHGGLQERILSTKKLPFRSMNGGYASHFGLSPADYADFESKEEKGLAMKERLIDPLFAFNNDGGYYVYFNIDDPRHLRKVLADPEKYAPGGIYIMRIHGTFVNFLDLSPAIQEDIIARLALQ
ncbi:MAG: pyruvate formate lyase family protein, partial [Candidatus Sumerlaeota bacterium]